ncbi:uncharacterized protein [Onthophagus taurus]|uniref:uncharacterized protein n=1 Tax=Onthophagus taurus TaxID=166361 RepID=UPI0039BE9F11
MESETLERVMEINFKKCKPFVEDLKKDHLMTSSTMSANSSITSPGDSGVQLFDSESELTSVMSASAPSIDSDDNSEKTDKGKPEKEEGNKIEDTKSYFAMTKSDVVNQNINKSSSNSNLSSSVPNSLIEEIDRHLLRNSIALDEKLWLNEMCSNSYKEYYLNRKKNEEDELQMEDVVKCRGVSDKTEDLMNISLNSYELLDYTIQNKIAADPDKVDDMHVSLSEEVNENLKISLNNNPNNEIKPDVSDLPPLQEITVNSEQEQIVFRRQRKKKLKSDTPKKRVSFHEDILNSTKIDDIHINHGFITIEPDISMNFFQRGFRRKPDVVKGRYSWAAEGDAPYYESTNDREIKSDIYTHTSRFSSTSSSSNESSIDEEDSSGSESQNVIKKEPSHKLPKASCLKKTNKKYIDTNIVEENNGLKKKKSETNLLDGNIFGSLKNILNFSSSVPLAERGVPEGQEDVTVYSSSVNGAIKSRRNSNNYETTEAPAPIKKIGNLNLELAKTNLKLTKSEGFYPNYPQEGLPSNVILCDSNVYEHKGISYSYEYDNFQKSFEQQKPKSSTIYQMILKEFNIFKRKAKENLIEDFEHIDPPTPVAEKITTTDEIEKEKIKITPNKYASSTKLDWSDNETVSDFSENSTKHLNSPKRKISKPNHYAIQNFKFDLSNERGDDLQSKSLPNLRPSSSKSSLINRFLRNVTIKKMMDLKVQNKIKSSRRCLALYIKGVRVTSDVNESIDQEIEDEIVKGRIKNNCNLSDGLVLSKVGREILRDQSEMLLKVFPVASAYTTFGESKPVLLILTNTTLYISSSKPTNSLLCNHFVLPYTELNTILIGPNAQTIHLSNYDNDMQCIITTGCGNLTGEIIGQMEMAMRRDKNKPNLAAVKQLTMRDMVNLRQSICKQTSVDKDEEYFYYSIIKLQEYNMETNDTPMGPNKEGPLMFKISENESRWETAYFILKAGVLYMLSSPSHRVPMRVLPLINGACQGARRIHNYPRPHTFQLNIGGTTLHLAAPDEYVASDWLQALVHAASGTYTAKERHLAQSCSLLLTSEHILAVREAFPCNISSAISKGMHEPIKGAQALSCAAISDITAFRLPSAEQSWCILEFSCREVHECGGDWILYFSSNSELENFISTLEMLWAYHNESGDSFPLSTIPETDSISRRCVDTYNAIKVAYLQVF